MGKCYRIGALIVFIFFITILTSWGQEILVSIDEDNRIDYIDAKMEEKLLLFPEYPDFEEARLFKISDSYYILEITYKSDGRLAHHRLSMSQAQTDAFRKKVTNRIESRKHKVKLNQEGRNDLLLTTTVNSLLIYGNTLPKAFQIQENKGYVALYILTSAAGFFIPYLITENAPVPQSAATLGTYGSIAGLAHGYFIYNLFNEGKHARISDPGPLAMMSLMSMAETVIGYTIATKTEMTPGKAALISSMGTFGLGYGIGASYLSGMEKEFPGNSTGGAVASLVGASAGFLVGTMLSGTDNYTRGDVSVITTGGLLGAYIPCSAIKLFGSKDKNWYAGAALLGSAAGIVLSNYLVSGKDFTKGQGNYIALGTLASGVVGAGIGYALSDDGSKLDYVYSIGAIGAAVGFGAIYNAFLPGAVSPARLSAFDFQLNPEGLAGLINENTVNIEEKIITDPMHSYQTPVMSLKYKF